MRQIEDKVGELGAAAIHLGSANKPGMEKRSSPSSATGLIFLFSLQTLRIHLKLKYFTVKI